MKKTLSILILMAPMLAMAEELPGLLQNPQLPLATVIQKAFERSPQQQVLQAGNGVADARAVHAGGLLPYAPAVSMRHQNDTIGSGRNLREWEAALEIPIWMPGQRGAREALAQEAKNGMAASREGLLLNVAGQVRDAVWDVAMNRNNVELADQRFKTAQALQADVEKRWQAGELAKTDVMLAKNESLQAQTVLLRAEAELKHAEHRYWILTGLKEIPAQAEEPLASRTGLDDAHPLLAEMNARVAMASGERELVRVEKRENPQFLVSARNERGAFDNAFNNSVGFAIRVPLDAAVRSAPMLAGAEMGLAQAMGDRDQLRLGLETALHEAEHNLEVIRSELRIVESQHSLAQENLRLARKAFSLGESDLVSLLRVQAMAQEAERALRIRETQLQWNIARYNQAVGVTP